MERMVDAIYNYVYTISARDLDSQQRREDYNAFERYMYGRLTTQRPARYIYEYGKTKYGPAEVAIGTARVAIGALTEMGVPVPGSAVIGLAIVEGAKFGLEKAGYIDNAETARRRRERQNIRTNIAYRPVPEIEVRQIGWNDEARIEVVNRPSWETARYRNPERISRLTQEFIRKEWQRQKEQLKAEVRNRWAYR